jgi:hypothetical protein
VPREAKGASRSLPAMSFGTRKARTTIASGFGMTHRKERRRRPSSGGQGSSPQTRTGPASNRRGRRKKRVDCAPFVPPFIRHKDGGFRAHSPAAVGSV